MEQCRPLIMMAAFLLSAVVQSSARPYPWMLAGPQDAATQRITACTFGSVGCAVTCQLQNCATGSCDSGDCQCERCSTGSVIFGEQQAKTEQGIDICSSCSYSCLLLGCATQSCDSYSGCQCSDCGLSAQSLSCSLGDLSCGGVCQLQNCDSGYCDADDECQCENCSDGPFWSFWDKNAKVSQNYWPYYWPSSNKQAKVSQNYWPYYWQSSNKQAKVSQNYWPYYSPFSNEQAKDPLSGSYQGSDADRQEAKPGSFHLHIGRRSTAAKSNSKIGGHHGTAAKSGGLHGVKATVKGGRLNAPSED